MKSLQERAAEALLEQINPVYYSTFLKVTNIGERLDGLLVVMNNALGCIRRTLDERRQLEPLPEYVTCDKCENEEVPLDCDRAMFEHGSPLVLCKQRHISRVRKRAREAEDAIREFSDLLDTRRRNIKRKL